MYVCVCVCVCVCTEGEREKQPCVCRSSAVGLHQGWADTVCVFWEVRTLWPVLNTSKAHLRVKIWFKGGGSDQVQLRLKVRGLAVLVGVGGQGQGLDYTVCLTKIEVLTKMCVCSAWLLFSGFKFHVWQKFNSSFYPSHTHTHTHTHKHTLCVYRTEHTSF